MKLCRIIALVFMCFLLMSGAQAEKGVLRAGGLTGDALYSIGGDQQQEMISIQNVILSKSGLPIEYTEYNTVQEGFQALQDGEIDMFYPVTPYQRDLEPMGLVASNGAYMISWDIIFVGEYSEEKLKTIAVPGGRLAPFYCREVFPDSELILFDSRLECIDAVIDGKAGCAIFNGFQSENIVQNGTKYSVLTYTFLPTDSEAVFALREDDREHLALVNECIAKTTEMEKTAYMVRSRAVSVEESAKLAFMARYTSVVVVVAAFFVLGMVALAVIAKRIILPLREFNRCIEKNEKLPHLGTPHLKKLAVNFNRLYDENAEKHRMLHDKAHHDGLTGLLNRRSFDVCFQDCQDAGEPYMLIIVDVDRFKEINDQYGHAAGDRVLKKVADMLAHSFRSEDRICRIGGDEFAIIALNHTEGFEQILAGKIDSINRRLGAPEDGLPAVSLSTGAAHSKEGLAKEKVYSNADAALYQVKTNGRGGFRLYEEP